MTEGAALYRAAGYARLSREDGDKPESDSIRNQQRVIEDWCGPAADVSLVRQYADDGFTGTNFRRPDFQRMLTDIEAGEINCVVVKDLSRFGRDYIDMGYYLERYFPLRGVRFVAVNDGVDSLNGPYDMLLPLKNIFNTQYARDISQKVRSAFRTKQGRGQFVGAFAPYGYRKDPADHSRLVVDPPAAGVVLRAFRLAAGGMAQLRIAKLFNAEHIPCPSEYKRLMGERYTNGRQPDAALWTYATVHRLLRSEVYIGSVVANRYERPGMHGRARAADRGDWIVVENVHEPIVSRELWDAVQAQIAKNSRPVDFSGRVSLFSGFLTCGDCGRTMCRSSGARAGYVCGSYRRAGASACASHAIREAELEELLLDDLNRVLSAAGDLASLAAASRARSAPSPRENEKKRLETALYRSRTLKKNAYEDYRAGLLSREEYLRYRADYETQEAALARQLEAAEEQPPETGPGAAWMESLLRTGALTSLDRATLAQTVSGIRVFGDGRLEIAYQFSAAALPSA